MPSDPLPPSSTILDQYPELRQLKTADKLQLVSELWDDLETQKASIPISPEYMAELDRRNEEYERDPSRVTTWEAVKRRILGDDAAH